MEISRNLSPIYFLCFTFISDPVVLDDTYEVVVAIDFGTAASGYSYSYKNNKEEIFMNKNWGAEMGVGEFIIYNLRGFL